MQNCKIIADVALFFDDKVLLVKYSDANKYDHQSGWFLPDDQLKEFEHPDDAVKRILLEQLNLTAEEISLKNIESFQGNDRSWHLVFHYRVDCKSSPQLKPSSDINIAEWFDARNLPDKKDVAHHGWALYTIMEML